MVNRMRLFSSYRWLLCFLLFFAVLFDAQAQSRQSLEEQRKLAQREIEETTRFLGETEQIRSESVNKLNLLIAQEKQFDRLINSINAEIANNDRGISETSAQISRMTNDITKMKTEYAQLIFHTYKNRGQYKKMVYVLSAKDFNEAYRRMKYFQQYSEYRKKQAVEITEKQDELRVVIEQLTAQKAEKEKLLAEQVRESKRLEQVRLEQNKTVSNLRTRERNLRTQLTAQRQKVQRLQNEIDKLVAAEVQKRNTTTTNTYDILTPEERLISNNFKGNKGKLPWPTEKGAITGFYGKNIPNPIFKDIRTDNNGVDITTVSGSEVRAVFDGEVRNVGVILGNNMYVLIRHGAYITVYQNLVDVTVKQGEKVKSKQSIGKVYTEKGAKTAVLHFEIREERNPLDPEQWIAKN